MKKLFFVVMVLALALGLSHVFPSLLFAQAGSAKGRWKIQPVPPESFKPIVFCGDERVEGSEECDDGNTVAGDGCSPTCRSEECACGWEQRLRFRVTNADIRPDIAVDLANNIYVVGASSVAPGVSVGLGCPGYRIWIAKYDRCGEELWVQEVWASSGLGTAITIGPDGFVYATSYFSFLGIEGQDILILKLNPITGAVLWSQNFDGPGVAPPGVLAPQYDLDMPLDILVDTHSNIFVAGKVTTSIEAEVGLPGAPVRTRKVPWVGKFRENPAGTGADLLAQYTYESGVDNGYAQAIALDVDEESIFVTGHIYATPRGLFLNKLSAEDLSPIWGPVLTEKLEGKTIRL